MPRCSIFGALIFTKIFLNVIRATAQQNDQSAKLVNMEVVATKSWDIPKLCISISLNDHWIRSNSACFIHAFKTVCIRI